MSIAREKSCLAAALRLLGRRDHSVAELRRKLQQRGFSAAQIEGAVADCRHYDYLDDRTAARNRLRHLRRRGYGPLRIRAMLREMGIEENLLEQTITEGYAQAEQESDCRAALLKKIKTRPLEGDIGAQDPRLVRYLLQRGFAGDVVHRVLRSLRDPNGPG